MRMEKAESCACPVGKEVRVNSAASEDGKRLTLKYLLIGVPLLVAWWLVYRSLEPFAAWLARHVVEFLTTHLISLGSTEHLTSAIEFFLYDTPKVLMLLILVVFGVGMVRSFFTAERTRRVLAGKRESFGNILAALLGIVTPFCTCSAVPLFIGFVAAGVPLGVTLSFLISAPMVNEIAVVLLFGLFGWQMAAIYLGTGLIIAMVAGWVIGRMHMEGHLEEWVSQIRMGEDNLPEEHKNWADRVRYGLDAVRDIVGRVWVYVVLGIAVGAGIHGYVPEGFLASFMGKDAWWSLPLAVLIGIPMYSNAAGIIPVVQALLEKGAALGTVLAFMMSVIALSLPEAVILRKVLKPRLIATFFGTVGLGILVVGYLFNLLL